MPNTPKIRLLVTDVDGTLTDGVYTVSDDGTISKRFHTHDFHGMMDLQHAGVSILVLTSSNDDCIKVRYNQLPPVAKTRMHLATGHVDKLSYLKKYLSENAGILMSEVAYIGDDINDLDCMNVVGYTGCPNDAHPSVLSDVNYICDRNGGNGAVREFIEEYLWKFIERENIHV